MSKMIELECPQCKSVLELDAGFAGGVCRCSSCGTLMTVPADPVHDRAELLTRPDRPQGPPPSRPAEPPGARPESPTSPAVESPAAADAATASPDTEVFTTASGKTIRVPRRLIVTASAKRRVIRGTIIGVFVAVMLVIVVGVALAVYFVTRPAAPEVAGPTDIHGAFDPAVNPFKLNSPNFLGIPLRHKAVLVIDASSSSATWMSAIKAAVLSAAKKAPSGGSLQVIFWGERGFNAFPPEPKTMDEPTRKELEGFLDTVIPRGDASSLPAVEKAMESKPDQIILVTGKIISNAQVAHVLELIGDAKVKLDAASVGVELLELEAATKKKDGRYIKLPPSQLNDWYREAGE
jgi:hypothetical protein